MLYNTLNIIITMLFSAELVDYVIYFFFKESAKCQTWYIRVLYASACITYRSWC